MKKKVFLIYRRRDENHLASEAGDGQFGRGGFAEAGDGQFGRGGFGSMPTRYNAARYDNMLFPYHRRATTLNRGEEVLPRQSTSFFQAHSGSGQLDKLGYDAGGHGSNLSTTYHSPNTHPSGDIIIPQQFQTVSFFDAKSSDGQFHRFGSMPTRYHAGRHDNILFSSHHRATNQRGGEGKTSYSSWMRE